MDNSFALDPALLKTIAETQKMMNEAFSPTWLKVMAETQKSINEALSPVLRKTIAEIQKTVNEAVSPALLKVLTETQKTVNEAVNPTLLKFITETQKTVNRAFDSEWINAMTKTQERLNKSLKTFSLSSVNYAIANMPVLDDEEAEKSINNEPPVLTFEEKQDIANCVDIVTEHSSDWEHRLEHNAQSFKRDHPAEYVVFVYIILQLLLTLFGNWLFETIKVKLDPSANAPIVQEVPATNIVIIDRSHNYYYEVEFPSDDGKEFKRGWVGVTGQDKCQTGIRRETALRIGKSQYLRGF